MLSTTTITACQTLRALVEDMTVNERSIMLRKRLKKLVGSKVYCPALGYVKIVKTSVKETANYAAKRPESTLVALNLAKVIKAAKEISEIGGPKANKTQTKLKLGKMYKLLVNVKDIGVAKLMIGWSEDSYYVEYCCTVQK